MRLRHARREETIGRGAEAFARARAMLFAYAFYPPRMVQADERIAPGAVLHQRLRVGPLRFRGPVRVLDAWDEPARAGFRYEALPGHVERGAVTFELTLAGDDVRFRVESDSAPGRWYVTLAAPVARAVQRRAVDGAFKRMRAAAGGNA